MTTFWGAHEVQVGEGLRGRLGPLELWIFRNESEWHLAATRGAGEEARVELESVSGIPADLPQRRWASSAGDRYLRLAPVLPDRPVVARPDAPLVVLPREKALFFISIPAWVRVGIGDGVTRRLLDEPTLILSNSWMGSPVEGVMCYALRTRAKRTVDELDHRPYRAVCPVEIKNATEEELLFERLCLRVHMLAIYQGRRHMWTNMGRVTYRGDGDLDRVIHAPGPPPYDGASERLGESREPLQRGFLFRTLDTLKAFTDY